LQPRTALTKQLRKRPRPPTNPQERRWRRDKRGTNDELREAKT